ncbi:MAG: TetR/AcrR family transcriptional regulator, partial [Pseudomonadota bacterium]
QDNSSRKQGPKRSETSKAAILDATREEMIENGWRGFSVDGVARRAKASKQTIYRWWPSIGTMCLDAALALVPEAPTGVRDPVERIAALILPIEAAARIGNGHYVLRAGLLAAADDDSAGEKWRAWQNTEIRTPLRMVLAELAAKQVIRRDVDVDDAMESLMGPMLHRLVLRRAPFQEGYSVAQANRLLAAFALN